MGNLNATKHNLYIAELKAETQQNTISRLKYEEQELQRIINTLKREIDNLRKARNEDWNEIKELREKIGEIDGI